jgi:hypothetical protein
MPYALWKAWQTRRREKRDEYGKKLMIFCQSS